MPAPARISVPVKQTTPIKSSPSIVPKSPESIARPKARVVHRRRARARLDDTDTDEDLVREPRSDDDSDSASSILDTESETVSDSEQEQEPTRVPSPSHTPLVNGTAPSSPSPPPPTEEPAAFPQSVNWSEMVADENANGAADLPVIDFADLSSSTQEPPAEPASAPSPSPVERQEDSRHDASVSESHRRKPGQSVREAYRTRLDTDPAYVPTLGQFWSHDDRLLDKDLRSLSGWWRGRWQGRGRGRGFGGWGMRGRGRGGFGPGPGRFPQREPQTQPPEDAPPVDRAWTHDGFEEMKKVDEEQGPQTNFRGRGGLPRGRGGSYGGFTPRSEFAASPSLQSLPPLAPSESQYSSTSDPLLFGTGTRPWFSMKPERVWTKQFDAYLYFESALKPVHNQGLGQGVRVKLPSHNNRDEAEIVVRLPPRMGGPPRPVVAPKVPYGDRGFVVKLPRGKRAGKERAHEDVESHAPEDVITVADPPMDDPVPVLPPLPTPQVFDRPGQDFPTFTSAGFSTERSISPTQASASVQTPPEPPNDFAVAGPSHAAYPEPPQPVESFPPPPPPQLQGSAPSFQPSSPYGGSPFGYGAPALPLPPGIAVSESGVTYEISTGRAVFLHTPPPPPPPPQMQGPLYNPRPMPMHHGHHGSVHFLPPPPQHVSISPPGFLASPPIFSLPRQSSRVEIRAPGEEKGKEPIRPAANVNAEPFTPMGYYNPEAHAGFEEAQLHQQQQQHMAYQPTQYYYHLGPDGSAPYGYGQYAPVESQQYEQYPQDTYPQQQQHTGYY